MVKKELTDAQQNMIVQFLLQNSKDGKPLYDKMKEAGIKFNSLRRNVTQLWVEAKKQREVGQSIQLRSKKPKAPRRKRVQTDLAQIQNLELCRRATIRKLAIGIKCSRSTVRRWVHLGLIKAHISAIKHDLTAPNKLVRLRFTLQALEYDRICNTLKFKTMHNTIHIDEKWFYMTKASHKFDLTQEEPEPHRSCKSKKFITKVMFLCAVCRPLFDEDGNVVFDRKISIFPFTQSVPSQRNIKNRNAGTLETKLIQSITKVVIKECLINQINPAIMCKLPQNESKLIFIQRDNAKPYFNDSDSEFRATAS